MMASVAEVASAISLAVNVLKNASTRSITKASSLITMHVAFSSVKSGLKVKPSGEELHRSVEVLDGQVHEELGSHPAQT
jgi:hypothetical protein